MGATIEASAGIPALHQHLFRGVEEVKAVDDLFGGEGAVELLLVRQEVWKRVIELWPEEGLRLKAEVEKLAELPDEKGGKWGDDKTFCNLVESLETVFTKIEHFGAHGKIVQN